MLYEIVINVAKISVSDKNLSTFRLSDGYANAGKRHNQLFFDSFVHSLGTFRLTWNKVFLFADSAGGRAY